MGYNMAKNIFTEFPTYPVDQLSGIFINGISPESMTHDFEAKRVKHKQYKECIRDHEKGPCFVSLHWLNVLSIVFV